jgi:hypothetical protein
MSNKVPPYWSDGFFSYVPAFQASLYDEDGVWAGKNIKEMEIAAKDFLSAHSECPCHWADLVLDYCRRVCEIMDGSK